MAALEEKQNESKTEEEFIEDLDIKSIDDFTEKYEDITVGQTLEYCFLFGEGYAIYRVATKNNPNTTIIVRKISISTDFDSDTRRIRYAKIRAFYSTLYLLMKKTKLLNYYDLYITKEGNIKYLLITMEELQITLKDYVESKYKDDGPGITEIECKSIIKNLFRKLAILHNEGYVHGDVKPDNIMLRKKTINPEENGWRLIDYDGMQFIGDKEFYKTKCRFGTLYWTAPEMNPFIEDDGDPENYNQLRYGIDMWGMGLIILYILNGSHLYQLTKNEAWWAFNIPWAKNRQKVFYEDKLLIDGKYDMDSDKNKGEIWLRNYLISLYFDDKISKNLFNLLHDDLLVFDPRKRGNCADILNHPWFK